ncbi:helix-turn-helix transcriptional regulator [Priestia filamentosa]|uniref:helix-turn-helix transcriptional regulator n=1 Tax=Priestia filamentosa TaxID=1402861 RepID=UPI003982BA5C
MKNIIKELRREHNLSQENLAEKLNVSRQTIISLENERYNPSLPLAMRIAKVFKTNVEKIFFLEED